MSDHCDGEGTLESENRIWNLLQFVRRKEKSMKHTSGPDQEGLLLGSRVELTAKKKGFSIVALRRFGCTTSSVQVCNPMTAMTAETMVVRSSSDWHGKKSRSRRKNSKGKKNKKEREREWDGFPPLPVRRNPTVAVVSSLDTWCSPREDGSVDWIVPSFREQSCQNRVRGAEVAAVERIEKENLYPRTRDGSQEQLDSPNFHFDFPQSRHLQRAGRIRRSPGGLNEIMMFQRRTMLVEMNMHDRYSDWRLDVDNMSYEELLELGDRIGYVNTGLKEDEIHGCLRKTKHSVINASPIHFSAEQERKCSICQEEYDVNEEIGKISCGHSYHIDCIKQWLHIKNTCPVCKVHVGKN